MSAVPVPFACAPLDDGSCPRPLPPSSLNSELLKSGLLCLVVIVVAAAAAEDEEGEAAEVRYVGPVEEQKGVWVGIEWDDVLRG